MFNLGQFQTRVLNLQPPESNFDSHFHLEIELLAFPPTQVLKNVRKSPHHVAGSPLPAFPLTTLRHTLSLLESVFRVILILSIRIRFQNPRLPFDLQVLCIL
jgi:hypothetical protein